MSAGDWKGYGVAEGVTDNLRMLASEAQEKARLVRNCPRCRGTWQSLANGDVTRCSCYQAWKTAMIDLRTAAKDAKEELSEWETDDMYDHHSVNEGSLEGLVDPEKFRTLEVIVEQGLFEGINPPYMAHFERIHAERVSDKATERW